MDVSHETRFAARLISNVAGRMVGKTGLLPDDIPDLQQDLWLELLSRLPSYRSERGGPRAFITLVVKNGAASILKTRAAAKRGNDRPCLSLHREHEDDDGGSVELHEAISADDYLRRTRGTIRSEEERQDLALDVRKIVSELPPIDRVVCLLLIDQDVCGVARVVGIPRSTLRDLIKRLRLIGEEAGLEEYFE